MEVWEYGAIRNRGMWSGSMGIWSYKELGSGGVEVWEYGAIRNRGMWSGSMGIWSYKE